MHKIRKLFFSTTAICVLTVALTLSFTGCGQEGAKVETQEEALKKLQTLSDEDQKKPTTEAPAK
jgi:hypothetical protein